MNVKNLVRPWLHSLEPYPPGKPIDELEREYGITDSIKLASNENPLGPSPKALAAMQCGARRHPPLPGRQLLSTCAARWRASSRVVARDARLRQRLERDHRARSSRTFLHAGDEAVMADQAFVIYRMRGAGAGRHAASSCRCAASRTTSRRWPRRSRRRRALVFLANPNNPTGTIFPRAVGGVSRRACRATWSSSWTRRTPSSSTTRAIRTRSPTLRGEPPADRAAHLLEDLRPRRRCASATAWRATDDHRPAEPRARSRSTSTRWRRSAALAALDDDEHVERDARGQPRGAWPTCARRSPTRARVGAELGELHPRAGRQRGAQLYDALLRLGRDRAAGAGVRLSRARARHGRPAARRTSVCVTALAAPLLRRKGAALPFERAGDRRRRADRRLAGAGGARRRAGRRGGRHRPQRGATWRYARCARHRRPRRRAIPRDVGRVDLRRARGAGAQHRVAVARRCCRTCAPGTVLTDVGSVKGEVRRRRWRRLLPGDRPFVGGASDRRAASAPAPPRPTRRCSAARRCILTPTPRDRCAAALARVRALWERRRGARRDDDAGGARSALWPGRATCRTCSPTRWWARVGASRSGALRRSPAGACVTRRASPPARPSSGATSCSPTPTPVIAATRRASAPSSTRLRAAVAGERRGGAAALLGRQSRRVRRSGDGERRRERRRDRRSVR